MVSVSALFGRDGREGDANAEETLFSAITVGARLKVVEPASAPVSNGRRSGRRSA